MAFAAAILKSSVEHHRSMVSLRRCLHAMALPSPMNNAIEPATSSPPIILPESDRKPEISIIGFNFPAFIFGGSMELMAVPKKKTSPHKRGIRNGPKALKPVPVIVRCRSCGRVKLPHFYCCSGIKEHTGEENHSTR